MSQIAPITPPEWRWAIRWSVIVLILSCLPYLIALLLTPAGWEFAGILVNPLDGHSYLAKIRQGMAGSWLFQLTYTPEPGAGAFIFTFYLGLGHLAAWLGLSPILIFHLARLVSGLVLLLVAFGFIAWVTPHPHERRLAFVLVMTASGLGWLGVIFGAFPIDLWIPEAFVPYSLYVNPHFPLSMALMLIILQRVAQCNPAGIQPSPFTLPPVQPMLVSGVAALALALTLPFALLTVWVVLAVFGLWLLASSGRVPWPYLWAALGVGLCSAPVILYDYWVSATNPILAGWSAQNVTLAPPLLDFWLGYGLVGLLAIWGGWLVVRQGQVQPEAGSWLVLWWAVAGILLVYLPFNLQRRLITGLHLPLCLLAATGLSRWLAQHRLKPARRRLLTSAIVVLGALGSLFGWTIPLLAMLQPPDQSETTALLFMRRQEVAALAWLQANAGPNDVILASPRVAMFVPGQTGRRVFYGHPFETIAAKERRALAESFYRGNLATVPAGVRYLIYGPSEQKLGQPSLLANLPLVFSEQNLSIYQSGR
jgi:hypothetical protein